MSSRLLSALDARISKARDPTENACLRAEKAALLARQGHLDAARTELAALRARYDSRPNAVVSAWASLAEGLVIYFGNLDTSASDKIKRSLALSEAVQARAIQGLSSAWLAQMDFSSLDFESMLIHLTKAFRTAENSDHSTQSRACLVTAGAFHWAERLDLALPWYSLAHQHATAEGDDSTISALMHNMAWFRAAEARRQSVLGPIDESQARQTQVGAESVDRFDELIGTASLASLIPILRAQVLLLNNKYSEALHLLESHLQSSIADGLQRMECVMHADMAWCRLQSGDLEGTRREAQMALGSITAVSHVDDVAMTHSRLAQICDALGEFNNARNHASEASKGWRVHVDRQSQLVQALTSTLSDG